MLVEGNSWVSSIIKRLTGSRYSHCGFLFDNEWTVEADFGGIVSRPASGYPWRYDLLEIKGLSAGEAEALRFWATQHLGGPYDYGKVLVAGVYLWLRRKLSECKILLQHVSRIQRILDNRQAFYCAEFVWEGLAHIGIPLQTPRMLAVPGDFVVEPALRLTEKEAPHVPRLADSADRG